MLKLLTRIEYQNSIEDLVGIDFNVSEAIPFDDLIEGYFNNAYIPVTEGHVDAYLLIAERVAAWSAERNFAGVVDCGFNNSGTPSVSNQECQSRFLDNFATRSFRRPLTNEEWSTFQALFDESLTGGDIKAGLELGITALLSSPQFLYRSEAGTAVEDLLSDNSGVGETNQSTINGVDFQTKTTGAPDGNGWNIYSEGYIENSFSLSDHAVFQISMKGDVAQDVWPEMELVIDGTVVATQTVDAQNYQNYSFNIDGQAGTHQVQIRFTNDYYMNDEDRNLYVRSVMLSGAQGGSNITDNIDLQDLDPDTYVLSNYELASYLSYTITGSTPDAQLLNAAQNDALATPAQIREQITRLLATDRAKKHLMAFAAQWLGTDEILNAQKDSTQFPDFNEEVRAAMAAEAKAFFAYVFYDSDQGFSDLFRADYVFVNNTLANYYGLGEVGTNSSNPNDLVKVDATSAHRGGLVTMGAFMANNADLTESSPIKRAVSVRSRLLCQDIPQPNDMIATFRAEEAEKLLQELNGQVITNREFIATITKEPPCSECHDQMINPLGFGLEDFDASGRYRSEDANGLAIDSTGTLYGVNTLFDGNSIDFNGSKDLSDSFAELESVRSCFSANVFRYAMDIGHDAINAANDQAGKLNAEEKEDYGCSVNTLTATLASSNRMDELFTQLGTLDLVRFRKQRAR
jgi:hypothetical protein